MQPSQLIGQARRGDPEATAELLQRYRNYMLLLAQVQLDRALQRKLDPSDLVQETCLAVCRDIPQFRGQTEQEFAAWLRKIMANVCLKMVRSYKGTHRRSLWRERDLADDLDRSSASLGSLLARGGTPSQDASRREMAVVLADKLAELPEHYRQAIILHHIEGLTIAEVARRLDRSPQATNSLLARALVKLRSLMKGAT
jgi:RNA polymerase sigma-70 factor (ECF subfamily)